MNQYAKEKVVWVYGKEVTEEFYQRWNTCQSVRLRESKSKKKYSPSEICSGPRYGLTVKMLTSFKQLKILAAANNASAMRFGS